MFDMNDATNNLVVIIKTRKCSLPLVFMVIMQVPPCIYWPLIMINGKYSA